MQRLARFLALTPGDRHLLVEAAVLMVAFRLSLAVLSFRSVLAVVETIQTWLHPRAVWSAPENRVAWAVELVGRRILPGCSCLVRGLAGRALLSRRGCPTRLHLGVAMDAEGKLRAHAWLESAGRVVLGGPVNAFTPLTGPGAGA